MPKFYSQGVPSQLIRSVGIPEIDLARDIQWLAENDNELPDPSRKRAFLQRNIPITGMLNLLDRTLEIKTRQLSAQIFGETSTSFKVLGNVTVMGSLLAPTIVTFDTDPLEETEPTPQTCLTLNDILVFEPDGHVTSSEFTPRMVDYIKRGLVDVPVLAIQKATMIGDNVESFDF